MFFLFLVRQIISEYYYKDFTNAQDHERFGYIEVPHSKYNVAFLTIAEGMALMFVHWDDAIIEITLIESDKSYYTFTKETELNFFTFKEKVSIRIDFKKSISFYVCPLSTIDPSYELVRFSNLKTDVFHVDQTNLSKGVSVYYPESYILNTNPKLTIYNDIDGSVSSMPTHSMSHISHIKYGSIEGIATISASSANDINPTVPTVVEFPLSQIVKNGKVVDNIAMINSTMKDIRSINGYYYVFLKNEITDNKKYKLYATFGNQKERVEIKKGEIFKKATNSLGLVGFSIESKNCNKNDVYSSTSGKKLEINAIREIVVDSFTDDDIPSHCIVKDSLSPGIIAAIVIVVIVVVAAIIVVVIIIIRKKKSHNSSQEGNSDKNIEQPSVN